MAGKIGALWADVGSGIFPATMAGKIGALWADVYDQARVSGDFGRTLGCDKSATL